MNKKHLLMILALGAAALSPAMADDDADDVVINSSNGDGDSDDLMAVEGPTDKSTMMTKQNSPREDVNPTVEALLADALGEADPETNTPADQT